MQPLPYNLYEDDILHAYEHCPDVNELCGIFGINENDILTIISDGDIDDIPTSD